VCGQGTGIGARRALCVVLGTTVEAGLDSLNTKLELLTRVAYGFHSLKPLIALAMLEDGDLWSDLSRLT